jgi:ankyrin repeat protein
VETIKALLDGGADIMAQEADGWTPLHRAASCFDCPPENIDLLLTAGASVMVTDEEGMTPWDYAQENRMLKDTTGYFALKEARFK